MQNGCFLCVRKAPITKSASFSLKESQKNIQLYVDIKIKKYKDNDNYAKQKEKNRHTYPW